MKGRAPRGVARGDAPAWDPLRDLIALRERANRLLEAILRKGDFSRTPVPWSPPVDLIEERDAFVLIADVPGVRSDDLSLRVEGSIVTLAGRRPLEKEARSAQRIERSHGAFERIVHLPGPAEEDRVTARLELGVLQVVLPRSRRATARPIEVRVRP